MAIEPIKGFYVHDEETGTDGVAHVSFEAVDGLEWENVQNRPDVEEMAAFKKSIGAAFLAENNGILATGSSVGNLSNSSVLDSMNILALPADANALLIKCPVYASSTTFGVCFYETNDWHSCIKGYTFNVGSEYGEEWHVFYIPEGATYWRTSWYHDTTTYGEWEGYYCYGVADRLSGADVIDFQNLDADLYGSGETVEYTYHDMIVVSTSGTLYRMSEGSGTYGSISVQLEPNAEYIINATDNELMRIGFTQTENTLSFNGDTSYKTIEWLNVTDKNHYRFKNTNGYPYMFVFGKTPNFPNATFEVLKAVGGLVNEEKQEIETGVVDLIDHDAKYFYNNLKNSYINAIDGFRLYVASSFGVENVNFSLSDISKNLANQNMTEAINGQPGIATVGYCEVVDVYADLTFGDTSFTECSVAFRKPNTSTSMQRVFKIVPSDLTDGHITIEKQLHFETGTELGVLFIYYANSTTKVYDVTGTLSVKKRKQTIDEITINDTPYYLHNAAEPFDMARGYVKEIGKLHKNGKYIVDENDVPVELRGIGTHHLLQYKNLHNRKAFDSLRRMGVNMIRPSAYLEDYNFLGSDGETAYGYISRPEETRAEIEKIIKICIDLGLYVLLDWHVFYDSNMIAGQTYTGYARFHETEALEFFEYFTEKYGDYPNMIYDLCNEPYFASESDIVQFVQAVRAVIVENVDEPVMTCGYGAGQTNDTWYTRSKRLYDAFVAAGITDVFVAPHIYGSNITTPAQQLWDENIPIFCTEWGNSQGSGDGAGNDTAALANTNWFHEHAVAQSFWKFTDQTMTTSVLQNQGIINSEKWLDGFNWSDLSHNGVLHLNKYYAFIHDEWIERTAIT